VAEENNLIDKTNMVAGHETENGKQVIDEMLIEDIRRNQIHLSRY
jgi:hypothetical protein